MRLDDFAALNERQRKLIEGGAKNEKVFVNPRNAAAGVVRQLDARQRRQAAAQLLRLRPRRGRRLGRAADADRRCSTRFDAMGLPASPMHERVEGAAGLVAFHAARRGAARRAAVRDRRRRLQGRRPRPAGPARLQVARAALGGGAEVPGAGEDDAPQRHRDPGRPHRQADAGGQARAGLRRRHDGLERDPAQPVRGAPQGRSRRRRRDRAPRRRRHPRGRRRACRATRPRYVAELPHAARRARCAAARSCARRAASTTAAAAASSAPAQRKFAILHFAGRRALDIEGLGEKIVDQLVDTGLVEVAARPLRADQGEASRRSSAWPTRAPPTWSPTSRRAGRRRWRASSTASASATSARRRPRTWRATSATSSGCAAPTLAQLLEVADVGPIVAESIHAFFAEPHNQQVIDALLAAGFEWPESDGVARRGAAAARRQDLRPHRHAADAGARRRQGDDRVARRQGRRLGVEEDRLGRRRRRGRLEARQGARRSASPCSTRRGLLALLDGRR